MKEKIIILVVSFLAVGMLNAQVKISGTVKDNRGRILAGASIQIKGSYDGGVSDSSGGFSFKTFEKGAQVIVASNVGYKSIEQNIMVGTDPLEVIGCSNHRRGECRYFCRH